MSLESICKQLSAQEDAMPPVELWDPPYCGEMGLTIQADGSWLHQGSVISRERLVKLFSTVIKKEHDDYFLVTPVEKLKINVEDKPFIITHWQYLPDLTPNTIELTTNTGDNLIINDQYPLSFDKQGNLQVRVRRNLFAAIHRNVFYQWAEIADLVETEYGQQLLIHSAGLAFSLGDIK
ncbi:DUF1285 domain-containing protein [Thalassotalea sp. ND16A]|uniref:DUF1285 domain-containing protein n=1 Tax=Thalassotalea sp. ND16A TaxID=1535422 RepID=UPI000519FC87|nr:DUF1285 domain-containing protein [Thalassotalea sp. ND16A]KGJ88122.1 hypothetical protein ND16A_2675 [Thalassotalea sp. ND16A]